MDRYPNEFDGNSRAAAGISFSIFKLPPSVPFANLSQAKLVRYGETRHLDYYLSSVPQLYCPSVNRLAF